MCTQRRRKIEIRPRLVAACTILAAILHGTLAACSVADSYSVRATSYNIEAFQARNDTALLNIMRAAYRQPIQLTDISTVTGTATATGSVTSLIPWTLNAGTLTPTASLSGGPSFGVANLNTQEVFQGFLAPIKIEVIGNLISQGARPEVLLPLIISDITLDDGKNRILFKGDVDSLERFRVNYSAILQLIKAGLSFDKPGGDQVGPSLSSGETKNLMGELLKSTAMSAAGNKVPSLGREEGKSTYILKQSGDWRFCIDPARSYAAQKRAENNNSYIIRAAIPTKGAIPLVYDKDGPVSEFIEKFPKSIFCGRQPSNEKSAVKLYISVRSLAGVYNFLGALTRIELGLDGSIPRSVTYGDGEDGFRLFRVWSGRIANYDTSVDYRGMSYSLAADPSGRFDASGEVMRIISDLGALQSKASNFPAPSVIPILR